MDDPTKKPPATPTPQPMPVSGKKEADIWAASDKVAKDEGDQYWENYAREIELEKEIEEMGGVEKIESGEVKVPAIVPIAATKPSDNKINPNPKIMEGKLEIKSVAEEPYISKYYHI